jgi:hypothetical protein
MAKRKRKAAGPTAVAYDDSAYRARDDLHTLSRAEEIRRDSARLKAAQGEARKQMVALQKVAGGDKAARAERLKDVEL